MKQYVILLLFALIYFSCSKDNSDVSESSGPQRFQKVSNDQTHISFSNIIVENEKVNYLNFNYIYIGGAVGVGDFNKDGLQDLYFVSNMGENKLYFNKGNLQFEDVTAKAGIACKDGIKTGNVVVDINNDGWPDIYQCRTGQTPEQRGNLLFINNHDGTFTESAAQYGLNSRCPTTMANFFDYDLDGDLDVYMINRPADFTTITKIRVEEINNRPTRVSTPENEWESDRLYRNNGDGTFSDVSKQAGIQNRAFSLSVTITDLNNDNWPDIYVGNDYIEPDQIYINNKNGTFSDRRPEMLRHMCHFSMGNDISDINNDGLVDVVCLDMNPETNERQKQLMSVMRIDRYTTLVNYGYAHQIMRNMLQLNNGNGTFSEIGCLAGIPNTDWSWAPLVMDYDNDGNKDIYISNGFRRDVTDLDYINYTVDSVQKTGQKISDVNKYLDLIPSNKIHNFMFHNRGDLTFQDVSQAWGFPDETFSNGAVYADLDNDGDMDLIVSNTLDPAFIYENLSNKIKDAHYLQIQLDGPPQNLKGIGARIQIHAGGQLQYEEMTTTRGFLSSVEPMFHFGLGKSVSVDKLQICWPDGKVQTLSNVKGDQRITLKYSDAAQGAWEPPMVASAPIFKSVVDNDGLDFVHKENPFLDFDRERLIPHMLSNQGPAIAKGDVNGDGLEDVYVGGAFFGHGALYLQTKDSKFTRSASFFFPNDTLFEDVACTFLDADGDKDLDLYVVSGGNEAPANTIYYQDRLYLNDGKGEFKPSFSSVPRETDSGGCVTAFDYDQDGDLDLFVGGRVVPGFYPTTPRSTVLQNNKGSFADVTDQVSPSFRQAGMVSGIAFADLDKDGTEEMIVTGEWMPIEVYKKTNGVYADATESFGLANSNGWWNCVSVADLDKDGDMDLIAGNLGLNSRLKATADEPIKMYAKDFDANGSVDPIMAYYWRDVCYPLPTRDLLLKQVPSLKKKFTRYSEYSKARMEDLYSESDLASAQRLEAKTFETSWFENQNGKFIQHSLPKDAQFAPVKQMLARDLNGDGNPDLLIVGNDYGTEIETGRYDAGNGLVLLGDGKGKFTPQPNRFSGLWASLDARNVLDVKLANGKTIYVVANNNDRLQVFEKL